MNRSYDLLVSDAKLGGQLMDLGWTGACFSRGAPESGKGFESLSAKLVSGDVIKNARKSLDTHDLIYFELSDLSANRKASECWEVDAFIVSDEYVKQARPGKKLTLDYVSLKNMAEKGIALIIPLNLLLARNGYTRATAVNTLIKTVKLARKAKTTIVLASGAENKEQLRTPLDMTYYGKLIGVSATESRKSILRVIFKAKDRKNPDVITAGLTVVNWGKQKPAEKKRMFGWY